MEDESVKVEALRLIGLFGALPRLVVFDLDYTLWPFYCEMHSKREMPSLYPHAKGIMLALKEKGIEMAIASRSPTPDIANAFIDKLGIQPLLVTKEIFSSWSYKKEHFQRIYRSTRVPFESMLFFDDEHGNINEISKMGVTSILVDNGMNLQELQTGLEKFSKNSNRNE
ncbi:hypothetical protein HPP92_016275 [Vanilla planifolia]|uniref:Magnesium-dependent phosphatase 1 n=1 Tax=Vanilla planifolia TaxID=51239 RepID=A0A835UNW4_VANPL|nr:hypothetical protein HPP92_016899 [Vanilla planifolia]KAG0471729.1 hypothetical protein HPP92_016275 [Vanilla planifolia]